MARLFDVDEPEPRVPVEVSVHAAAFVVSLLKSSMFDEAESFVEWYGEQIGYSAELENLVEG